MLLYVSLFSFVVDPPRSVFEPRVSGDGGFAAVSVVVEQLLALVDVSGGDEDEVRDAVDVVEFGLAVSVFTVINQPTQAATLFCGVHTVGAKKKRQNVHVRFLSWKMLMHLNGERRKSNHQQELPDSRCRRQTLVFGRKCDEELDRLIINVYIHQFVLQTRC